MSAELDLMPPPDEDELQAPPEDEPCDLPEFSIVGAAAVIGGREIAEGAVPVVRDLVKVAELLPADSPLPLLIRFVPNQALRVAADRDAATVLAMQVTDDASCQRMDELLSTQRVHKHVIEASFKDPTDAANKLHKSLTSQRGEFLEETERAIKTGGDRIWHFNKQKEREAAEERRRQQEEADRKAREDAEREAAAARAAQAPASLIEQLEEQAKTATAPPVRTPVQTPRETLKRNTLTDAHKARLEATPASALELEPDDTTKMTDAERLSVLTLLKAIIDGRAPISFIKPNWSAIQKRANSDKSTFKVPGLVVYETSGGTRGKSTRTK